MSVPLCLTDLTMHKVYLVQFSSVGLGCVRLFGTPWTIACQASLSINNSQSLPKLMSIESVMPSHHLILCHPLLLLPSIFPNIRVFSNESALLRWPKYWSFGFNIRSFNEHPGLISFRMDWLDLLAVQGTLKSLLQCYSSEASILLPSAFFIIQFSHPYMTTGKTIALTRWTFVDKVMSLLFNMLLRLVIGEGNGTPLQYFCLENPMDRGAWWAVVHGVAKSRTWLSNFTFTFHFHALEKEMATHSSVLAWRIPRTREPDGLPSLESHRVGHDWSDLAAAAGWS